MIIGDDLSRIADLITAVDTRDEAFGQRPAIVFAATFGLGHGIDRLVIVPEVVRGSGLGKDHN